MRRESRAERDAWTAHIEGKPAPKPSKYGNVKVDGYDSKHEAAIAGKLATLQRMGVIHDLKEQVPIVLIAGQGKIRPIKYIADFTYHDKDGLHVVDAKGFKTQIYRLKKKMAALLLGIEIEEV